MLSRIKGEVVFTCDGCEDSLETETDDFEQARTELRQQSWKTSKDEDTGEWLHHCPTCKPAGFNRWMD